MLQSFYKNRLEKPSIFYSNIYSSSLLKRTYTRLTAGNGKNNNNKLFNCKKLSKYKTFLNGTHWWLMQTLWKYQMFHLHVTESNKNMFLLFVPQEESREIEERCHFCSIKCTPEAYIPQVCRTNANITTTLCFFCIFSGITFSKAQTPQQDWSLSDMKLQWSWVFCTVWSTNASRVSTFSAMVTAFHLQPPLCVSIIVYPTLNRTLS